MQIITIKVGTPSRNTHINEDEYIILHRLRVNLPDILVMLDHGVFDFKRGRALIHRDDAGQLRKIEVELIKWSKYVISAPGRISERPHSIATKYRLIGSFMPGTERIVIHRNLFLTGSLCYGVDKVGLYF